eukprot:CAMPEP_0181435742 /NCGR_PEP_ID=MMETSP1110-20121109/20490_1 /TAXON_ID=174948 /ORGANISM="Symbiodinium sp., Strain CCMP421" /LENGTH=231 /DNA_ID=CAMNT_0023559287 /DNA_START=60 /DNA_END=755 /DNA_ORIENTATION=-
MARFEQEAQVIRTQPAFVLETEETPVTHWKTYDFFEDTPVARVPSAETWDGLEELDELCMGPVESEDFEEATMTPVLTFDPFEPALEAAPRALRMVPFPVSAEPQRPAQLCWRHGRKLQSSEQMLSPVFHLELPSDSAPFRVILAKETCGRNQGFAKAKGVGRIFLKCESSQAVRVQARITVSGAKTETRGPFLHDFNESSCCPLGGEWGLAALLDATRSLEVQVELVAPN